MPRPAIPDIKTPSGKSQLSKENEHVSGGVCGGSWKHSFELVRPWGSVNNYKKRLDALGDYDDPDKLPNPDFIAKIEDAIEQTWDDLDKYDDEGVIKVSDYEKIRKVLNRGSTYASVARKLDAYWAEEYVPEDLRWDDPTPGGGRPLSPVRNSEDVHWPLDEGAPWQGACGFAGGDAPIMRDNAGKSESANARAEIGGFYKINFKCPTNGLIDQHIKDRGRYGKLMKAAAENARCGQELVYTIAFYALNHREAPPAELKRLPAEHKRLAAKRMEFAPTPPPPGAGFEEPPVAEEEKPKSNVAILALGAAAIVLLASRKR